MIHVGALLLALAPLALGWAAIRRLINLRPNGLLDFHPLTEAQLADLAARLADARERWTGPWYPVPDEHGLHHPIYKTSPPAVGGDKPRRRPHVIVDSPTPTTPPAAPVSPCSAKGCPMTGGECPSDQSVIDRCPEC